MEVHTRTVQQQQPRQRQHARNQGEPAACSALMRSPQPLG